MKTNKTLIERFEEKIYYSLDGCWYWLGSISNTGYGRILVDGINKQANRVSYMIYKGDPADLFVCHTCDNRNCVNPDHLWLGTNTDNMRDMSKKGRHRSPEVHPNAKLSDLAVADILTSNERNIDLARTYGMSRSQICKIKLGQSWAKISRLG